MKTPISQAGTSNKHSEAGFTLIELLVVLVILAIGVGSVTLSVARHSDQSRIADETFKVASRLRAARATAIRNGREVVVWINLQERSIASSGTSAVYVSKDFLLEVESLSEERSSQSTIGIRFFPNGASTGGVIRMGKDTRINEIRVNWFNGRINVLLST